MTERLFIGIYANGISYADREREEAGDYKKLAFLPYNALVLRWYGTCEPELKAQIEAHAQEMQSKRFQFFQTTTCGQGVILGE